MVLAWVPSKPHEFGRLPWSVAVWGARSVPESRVTEERATPKAPRSRTTSAPRGAEVGGLFAFNSSLVGSRRPSTLCAQMVHAAQIHARQVSTRSTSSSGVDTNRQRRS